MSFSPRARPDTVNLPFSDPDVTDTYRDDRSSNNASSPRHRHPTGDSPLSRRAYDVGNATGSSPRQFGSSRAGSQTGSEANNTARIRSNLDKLLDLLDQDEDDLYAQPSTIERSLGMETGERTAMSTPPPALSPSGGRGPADPSSSHTPRATHARKSASYSVPRPPYSPTTHTQSDAGRSAHPSFDSTRPPLSARGSSALELLQRANGFDRGDAPRVGQQLPDSPSPRPGSVAALRRSDIETNSRSGLQDESAAGLASGFSRMAVNGESDASELREASRRRSNNSLDSIARVAEAAQREFDDIISETTLPDGRPASRLRSAPTPPRTASAQQAGVSHAASSGGKTFAASTSAERMNQQLVQELREAQDYIAYLQEELRAISDVVVQLREQPDDARAETSYLPYRQETPRRSTPPPPAALTSDAAPQASAQAVLAVMQHTLATLPSLTDTSAPLESFARTLDLTRRLDQLVHRTRDQRRDEDVFAEQNLTNVLRTVEFWSGGTG
ncbi:hypothetical protein JCM3774_004465 [Rhodotorula dairenensis]